jgi:hypothetical protein
MGAPSEQVTPRDYRGLDTLLTVLALRGAC